LTAQELEWAPKPSGIGFHTSRETSPKHGQKRGLKMP